MQKEAKDIKPKASTATVSFSNLDTNMVLDFKSRSDNAAEDIKHEAVLASGGVGPAGFQAGPIKIGLTWEIKAFVRYKIRGATQVRVAFGGNALGHSALITADFVNPNNRRNTGWNHFKPKATKGSFRQLSHEMTVKAGIGSSLEFGFELPNAKLELSVEIPFPQVRLSLESLEGKLIYQIF